MSTAHILLIGLLILLFCGPLVVIRVFLSIVTLIAIVFGLLSLMSIAFRQDAHTIATHVPYSAEYVSHPQDGTTESRAITFHNPQEYNNLPK
jgi:predicted lipid-binding transport protein (Tim44 family)